MNRCDFERKRYPIYRLSILGPSSTWLVRRLVNALDAAPDGFELDLSSTATELGLGHHSGRNSPFVRSIERCCRFGATDLQEPATLLVRRRLPPLTRAQVEQRADALRAATGGDGPLDAA